MANIGEQQINEILQQRSYLHIERSLLRHTFKRHEPFLGVKYWPHVSDIQTVSLQENQISIASRDWFEVKFANMNTWSQYYLDRLHTSFIEHITPTCREQWWHLGVVHNMWSKDICVQAMHRDLCTLKVVTSLTVTSGHACMRSHRYYMPRKKTLHRAVRTAYKWSTHEGDINPYKTPTQAHGYGPQATSQGPARPAKW